jgi:glycerophosphoryl diester phosphodiesterase
VISSTAPRVIGHRGASRDHPENTLEAFVGARRQGAAWVELDVRATADDELAILHDPHLSDGRAIAELVRADVPEVVPSLDAALAACVPLGVNVEVKHGVGEPGFSDDRRLADLVVEALEGAANELLVSSFDLELIDRIRDLAPELPTAYLVLGADEPIDAVAACVDRGHAALHPWDPMVDADLVARCHAAGIAVNVWTVDDPDRMVELAAWGVDGIVTNVPAVAVAALARA